MAPPKKITRRTTAQLTAYGPGGHKTEGALAPTDTLSFTWMDRPLLELIEDLYYAGAGIGAILTVEVSVRVPSKKKVQT